MRTTINIDEDVMRAARSLAAASGKSLGEVISELARQSLRPRAPHSIRGFPVFQVSEQAATITPEMVQEALEDPK